MILGLSTLVPRLPESRLFSCSWITATHNWLTATRSPALSPMGICLEITSAIQSICGWVKCFWEKNFTWAITGVRTHALQFAGSTIQHWTHITPQITLESWQTVWPGAYHTALASLLFAPVSPLAAVLSFQDVTLAVPLAALTALFAALAALLTALAALFAVVLTVILLCTVCWTVTELSLTATSRITRSQPWIRMVNIIMWGWHGWARLAEAILVNDIIGSIATDKLENKN